MERAMSDCRSADPVALAAILSTLIQHAPAAATTQALALARASVDDRDWARVMAAIAPLPV
jgi:hypothetical protein